MISSSLTSAIGRIAPGRAEQWDVIMPFRLGNGKAQRDDIEEGRIAALDTPAAKVVAHGKAQFVAPDRQGTPADQRLVGAAIGIRYSRFLTMGGFARELVELDGDADSRTAGMGIQDVGAEPAVHRRHALAGHLARDPEPRDEKDFLQGGRELGGGVVANPALELREDRIAAVATHADHEGKTELRLVGVVQAMKAGELLLAQAVEADAGLLGPRIVGQIA